ncbi:MAG: hypothetical protein E4H17_04245 [Gemmatimonadales bacterium]|nr:MAG: hypothetical protein E4H17_04245 [Gemmatimonadales bacterium]
MADRQNHHHHHDEPGPEHYADPASQSLADALRVSFRLLTLIMIGVVIAFLLTGIKTIEPNQVGIMTRFGKVVGTAGQGLAYTWPYPVGDIEIVNVEEQDVTINDFWVFIPLAERTRQLTEVTPSHAVRLRQEGALLTGDQNLLHAQIKCKYSIDDPLAYRRNVGELNYRQDDLNSVVRTAMAEAATRAAAHYTADGLQLGDRDRFASEARMAAQELLDKLDSGIRLRQVLVTNAVWPLKSLMIFTEAQNAISEAERRRNEARGAAERILNAAAGANYRLLVGDPTRIHTITETDPAGQPLSDAEQVVANFGLIGLYRLERHKADQNGDASRAEEVLAQIDQVLMSSRISGETYKVIADARAYSTSTVERTKSRVQRVNELLNEYEKAPELMLERLWAATRDTILSSPSVEKFYLTMGPEPTVVRINRSPETIRQLQQEEAKAAAQRREMGIQEKSQLR